MEINRSCDCSRLGPRVITSRIRPAAKEDSAEEDESERVCNTMCIKSVCLK